MPLLAPVLLVVFVTLMINVLKVFDLVFIIAPASVQPDANVLALQMWRCRSAAATTRGSAARSPSSCSSWSCPS